MADELKSWLKEWEKHSRNYPIKGHTNQFVERTIEIYKEKNIYDKRGGEEVVVYLWLSEFHIIVACEESRLMERHMV